MTPLPPNSSFSQLSPSLQLGVDSTSLGEFKICPRKYQLSIIEGWQPSLLSYHLTFGLLAHSCREVYYRGTARGESHDEAMQRAIQWLLEATWEKKLGRPWISGDSKKNRLTLLRTMVWYLDRYGSEDPLETIILKSGQPAVELSFRFHTNQFTKEGEEWILCGHMDRLVLLNDQPYISDLKTTQHRLDEYWFEGFTPDNQFSLYSLAGRVIWELPIQGLIVDGVQVAVGFSSFQRGLVTRSESQLTEWYQDTLLWLRQMEEMAREGYWPQNDKACFRCHFRSVCSRPPEQREGVLKANFRRRIWDPLQVRGDI